MVTVKKGKNVKRVSADELHAYIQLGWIQVSCPVERPKPKTKHEDVKNEGVKHGA